MKIAVCCIGRMENRYINEFINHYLQIGVDKIFIYDNNYENEEHFEDIIPNELLNNEVEIINFRDLSYCQLKAYQDCYNKHNEEYDWLLFIDCDEFLHIEQGIDIKTFLQQEKFEQYDMIHLNWLSYGDNDLIEYENKSLQERFKNIILPFTWRKNLRVPENYHIKSIIRGKLKGVKWVQTPHTPIGVIKCCNAKGELVNGISPFQKIEYSCAYFKHYSTKTIDEWINIKIKRGYPDGNKNFFEINNPIKEFFKYNKITEEKINFIKENGLEYLL